MRLLSLSSLSKVRVTFDLVTSLDNAEKSAKIFSNCKGLQLGRRYSFVFLDLLFCFGISINLLLEKLLFFVSHSDMWSSGISHIGR